MQMKLILNVIKNLKAKFSARLNRAHTTDGSKRCRFAVNTYGIVTIEVYIRHL